MEQIKGFEEFNPDVRIHHGQIMKSGICLIQLAAGQYKWFVGKVNDGTEENGGFQKTCKPA